MYKEYPPVDRKTLRHLHNNKYRMCGCEMGIDVRTDVIPPILWLRNEAFTEGIRAWDLEFI